MFSSYFFIPADKLNFIEKVYSLKADYFIFDMEESVSNKTYNSCIGNLRTLPEIKENFFIRIPINYETCGDALGIINGLYLLGFKTFLLPKLNTGRELSDLIDLISLNKLKGIRFGLLVESPQFLIEFYTAATANREMISLVLIGSHDYCNTIGCKHSEENLIYIKQKLLSECKALDIPIVDCVSTDFSDLDKFKEGCVKSCNSGFDGRAIIHPKQLQAFNNARYYTEEEVREAIKVKEIVDKIDRDSFSTLNVEGKLYEKPHLKRIYNIAEWHLKHQIYDL